MPDNEYPDVNFNLHNYQEFVKNFIISHPYCGIWLDMGLGKAIDDDTPVPLASGRIKRAGDIQVGDVLIGTDGQPTKVLKTYHHHKKKCYEVSLDCSKPFVCCEDHLIPIIDDIKGEGIIPVPAKRLYEILQKKYMQYEIPINKKVEYKPRTHNVHPYLMGAMIACGLIRHEEPNKLFIATSQKHAIDTIKAVTNFDMRFNTTLTSYGAHSDSEYFIYELSANPNSPESFVVAYNCFKNHSQRANGNNKKYYNIEFQEQISDKIFNEYVVDSIENRLWFLKGLMDTRGVLEFTEDGVVTFNLYGTFHKNAIQAIFTICKSLGYFVKCTTSICDSDEFQDTFGYDVWGDDTNPCYVHIQILAKDFLFSNNEKLKPGDLHRTLTSLQDIRQENWCESIKQIKEVNPRDVTCFTVDAPDHMFLIDNYVVTHNTRTTLAALWDINPICHVLIIAPKNIARSTWVDEIKKCNLPIRIQSLLVNERGNDFSRKKRHKMYQEILDTPPTVYFINNEKIPDLVNHLPIDKNGQAVWPFPVVIIDEAQSFKGYASERFKALKSVRHAIYRLIELSGTPQPKGLEDLWSQIYLLDQGERLGKNISAFRREFMMPTMMSPMGVPIGYMPLYGAEDIAHDRISDLVISMKNTILTLPPITYNDITVHLNKDEQDVYKTMLREQVIDIDPETTVKAVNAAVLQAKLTQMASGALYTDDKHNFVPIHWHKCEHCEYIVNNTSGNVIIAYHYHSDKDMILEYFEKQRKSKKSNITPVVFDGSPEMKDAWNNGEYKVMLLQPASAGHGLNLQFGGHTLIWYTIPMSLEHYLQTVARIYRQGQTQPVVIHHLLTQGTIDRKNLQRIERKDMSQATLLADVKASFDPQFD